MGWIIFNDNFQIFSEFGCCSELTLSKYIDMLIIEFYSKKRSKRERTTFLRFILF